MFDPKNHFNVAEWPNLNLKTIFGSIGIPMGLQLNAKG
jgi:hypothetical protein